jgi:hypothetical protein
MAFRPSYCLTGTMEYITRKWPVAASQTIKRGMVLVLSSGLAAAAGDAPGAGTVLGVAASSVTTGSSVTSADTVDVVFAPNVVFEVDYTGSTKTTLADADRGTSFDFGTDATTIDLDDTTGGVCKVIGFDNTRKVAFVILGNRAFTY